MNPDNAIGKIEPIDLGIEALDPFSDLVAKSALSFASYGDYKFQNGGEGPMHTKAWTIPDAVRNTFLQAGVSGSVLIKSIIDSEYSPNKHMLKPSSYRGTLPNLEQNFSYEGDLEQLLTHLALSLTSAKIREDYPDLDAREAYNLGSFKRYVDIF